MKSNPNPSFYSVLPYESLSSHTSINKKIKENKIKRKNNNWKLKEKKKKRNINIDLVVLPSHDIYTYLDSISCSNMCQGPVWKKLIV